MLEQSRSRSPIRNGRSISPYSASNGAPQMVNQNSQYNSYANNYMGSNFKASPTYQQTRFFEGANQVHTYMQHQNRGGQSARGMNDSSYLENERSYYSRHDSPLRQSPPRK